MAPGLRGGAGRQEATWTIVDLVGSALGPRPLDSIGVAECHHAPHARGHPRAERGCHHRRRDRRRAPGCPAMRMSSSSTTALPTPPVRSRPCGRAGGPDAVQRRGRRRDAHSLPVRPSQWVRCRGPGGRRRPARRRRHPRSGCGPRPRVGRRRGPVRRWDTRFAAHAGGPCARWHARCPASAMPGSPTRPRGSGPPTATPSPCSPGTTPPSIWETRWSRWFWPRAPGCTVTRSRFACCRGRAARPASRQCSPCSTWAGPCWRSMWP